jgi:DNA polymerase I-like protein with 3'-5' exonuclease and polymerase domains
MLTVKNPKDVDWAGMSLLDIADGNAQDVYMTWMIFQELEKAMKKLNLIEYYDKLISPCTTRFARAEYNGLDVNMKVVDTIAVPLKAEIEAADAKLRSVPKVPKDINLGSSKQLVDLLFEDDEGFLLYPPNRSKQTGRPSADAPTIEELKTLIEEELEKRNVK